MYTGISLSSGAARGIYQLGALHAAECKQFLKDVKYYIGTSIGSMIALLLAVGWPITSEKVPASKMSEYDSK